MASYIMPPQSSTETSELHPSFSLLAHLDAIAWEGCPDTYAFHYVSDRAERILGFPRDKWYEPGFFVNQLHPEDRELAAERCAPLVREMRNHSYEYRLLAADGRVVWFHDRVTVVVKDGKVTKLCGFLLDITEKKTVELELREARIQLENAQKLTGIGSFSYNLSNGKWTPSAQCSAIFKSDSGTLPSYDEFLLNVMPSDRESLKRFAQGASDGSLDHVQCEFGYQVDGSGLRCIHADCRLERDAKGRPLQWIGTVQDVTERKHLEREQQLSHHFLDATNRVKRAALSSTDLDEMLISVCDAMLDIFDCDRVWIVCPSDTERNGWQVVAESTGANFHGTGRGNELGATANLQLQDVLAHDCTTHSNGASGTAFAYVGPVNLQIQTEICRGLRVRMAEPYVLGLHYCRSAHVWTENEERILRAIGDTLTDAISSLLAYRSLQTSEGMLAEAQRLTQLGYWQHDFVLNKVEYAPEVYRILGEPDHADSGVLKNAEAFLERIHIEDRARVKAASEEALALGKHFDVEYRIVRLNGEVRSVRSRAEVVCDKTGSPQKWFGTIQDITELRLVEQELRVSETRFRGHRTNDERGGECRQR